jgi:hypothetical protein
VARDDGARQWQFVLAIVAAAEEGTEKPGPASR